MEDRVREIFEAFSGLFIKIWKLKEGSKGRSSGGIEVKSRDFEIFSYG